MARRRASRPAAPRAKAAGAAAGRRAGCGRAALHACRRGSIKTKNSTSSRRKSFSCRRGRSSAIVSDVSKNGDYVTFEFFGQRGFVIRDDSGTLRAFHNVCAHRAHAVVERRARSLREVHDLLRITAGPIISTAAIAASVRRTRFRSSTARSSGSSPSSSKCSWDSSSCVSARESPAWRSAWRRTRRNSLTTELEDMVPLDDLWVHDVEHRLEEPGRELCRGLPLSDGPSGPLGADGVAIRSRGASGRHDAAQPSHAREAAASSWSAQRYARFLPVIEHLPEHMRRRWTYLGSVPECVLRHLPGVAGFLPGRAARARAARRSARVRTAFPDDRREMKAARWLCARLNVRVQAEDEVLTRSVQGGLVSGAYTQGMSVGQGNRAGRIPGLDPRAHSGRAAGVARRCVAPSRPATGSLRRETPYSI